MIKWEILGDILAFWEEYRQIQWAAAEEVESLMPWATYIRQEFGVENSDAYVNAYLDLAEQADPGIWVCLFYRWCGY